MFRNKESLEPLLDFLRAHKHNGHVSLIELRISLNILSCCHHDEPLVDNYLISFAEFALTWYDYVDILLGTVYFYWT